MYVAGEDQQTQQPFITKIDPNGVRVWGVSIDETNNTNINGRVNGITVHPTSGNLMVVCEFYDDYTYSVLFTVDQDTGRILDNQRFNDADSDVYLIDIAYNSSNSYVMAGSKYNEFTAEQALVKQTGSGTGLIKILRSSVDRAPATNWQIGGTGFSVFENIAAVERYAGLSGTTRQGSGATFNVIANDGDPGIYTVAVNAGGTNYLPGHKIKILGTALGGTTPSNDLIITVATATNGAIATVTFEGTSDGGSLTTYTAATGTNYNVGSGWEFTFWGPTVSTDYSYFGDYAPEAVGSNYVAGDVVVVAGTDLGGTTPANDLTITIYAYNGAVTGINTVSGTSQSTTWKLETTTQVDFSQSGSWTWTRPLARQNLLVTPTWQRTFGTSNDNTDRLYAVAVDSVGNIITVGEGYGSFVAGQYQSNLAMVYKFNSSGTLEWARMLNDLDSSCYAKSVATIGTDIYVTHQTPETSLTVITKLDGSGTVKWQRSTNSYDDSVIAATQDGNILVSVEAMEPDLENAALKVFLLTPSGETVYQRWLYGTVDGDTNFKNGRGLVVNRDSFYITAYFYANDYRSTLAARLPVDGSGIGDYSSFRYTGVNAMSVSINESGLADINYTINAVDLEDQYNYAGPLANGADPYVNENDTVTEVTWDYFGGESFYPDVTTQLVRDTDGGNIIFADGTKQNTSATDIPQRRYTGQQYTLGLDDRGHHILCNNSNDDPIIIPYNARVPFPIGTVITIVNDTGSIVTITKEGGSVSIIAAGIDSSVGGVLLEHTGIATLLKIYTDGWIISGNITAGP
jgi:hypothetical protein